MLTPIKKGTQVYVLSSYDRQGTVSCFRAIVDSCGKAQCHLRQLDGEMTKHRFYTAHTGDGSSIYTTDNGLTAVVTQHVVPVEGTNAAELGLKLAHAYLEYERDHLTRCLQTPRSPHDPKGWYHAGIQKQLDALHEPQVTFI